MSEILETYNQDIVGIYARLNRFIKEIFSSTSSGVNGLREKDYVRATSYLKVLAGYVAYIVKQPEPDYPESKSRKYELPPPEPTSVTENDAINDLIRLFETTRHEIVNSTSARLPAGLIIFDHERLVENITRMQSFMVDYIDKLTPIDLPASSPRNVDSGPGRTGI